MYSTAVELQTVLRSEQQTADILRVSGKRRQNLRTRVAQLEKQGRRLTEASKVLNDLQSNHSLNSAMELTLRQNRSVVEEIFSHIHSPAEFSGLGPSWNSLVRSADKSLAKLTEISSGQRAALALSIFLAQNGQLTSAPPVVLMDDPIAHVDDLNCLSFLDYLREIALTGKRQIFFATASDKLATLFTRKLDFMGRSFQRFELERE
jgi:exonuclease SbcC